MPSHPAASSHPSRASRRPSRDPARDAARGPALLRLSTTDEVLAAVPYLLGFHPARSLVVLGLSGPRGRLGVTMRLDLNADAGDRTPVGRMATTVVRALQEDGDSQAIVLLYDPGSASATSSPPSRRSTRAQPGEEVVAAVRAALRRVDIRLKDALRVEDGRWWSYLCRDPRCCPPEGSPVTSADTDGGPSLVAATAVHAGLAALPDRDALSATLEPPTPWTHEATAQALDRVGDDILQECAGDPSVLAGTLLDRVAELVRAFGSRRATLDEDQIATVVLALHVVEVRDTVITWTLQDDAETLQRLLVEVVRRTGAPRHVPAATVLAWCAYLNGSGSLASVALELVDRSQPDYSLARLVGSMLENGIHPDRLREVTQATAEELRTRRAGGAGTAGSGASDDQACG